MASAKVPYYYNRKRGLRALSERTDPSPPPFHHKKKSPCGCPRSAFCISFFHNALLIRGLSPRA